MTESNFAWFSHLFGLLISNFDHKQFLLTLKFLYFSNDLTTQIKNFLLLETLS